MNQHQPHPTHAKTSSAYYLYTRDGCCLCERAEALLIQHWPELWERLVIVNLSKQVTETSERQHNERQHKEDLIARYGHHVPVLVHRTVLVHRYGQYNQYDQQSQCHQHSEEWLFDCQTSAEEIQTLRLKHQLAD